MGSVSWDEARTTILSMESTRALTSSAFMRLTAQCHGVAAPPAQGPTCRDPAPVLPSKGSAGERMPASSVSEPSDIIKQGQKQKCKVIDTVLKSNGKL